MNHPGQQQTMARVIGRPVTLVATNERGILEHVSEDGWCVVACVGDDPWDLRTAWWNRGDIEISGAVLLELFLFGCRPVERTWAERLAQESQAITARLVEESQ